MTSPSRLYTTATAARIARPFAPFVRRVKFFEIGRDYLGRFQSCGAAEDRTERTDRQTSQLPCASKHGGKEGCMRVDRFFGNPVKIRRRRRCGRRKDGRTTQMGGEIRPFKDRLTKPSSFLPIGNPKPPASPSLSPSPLSFCPSQGILISWDFRNWVTRG